MIRSFLIGCLLLFVIACKNKSAVPSNILPQKKMQAVLWDLMRSDQFLNDYVFIRDTAADRVGKSTSYYDQVFALHKISADQFERSFTFYHDHPVLFRAIMDSIGKAPAEAPTQIATPLATDTNKVQQVESARFDSARKMRIRPKAVPVN